MNRTIRTISVAVVGVLAATHTVSYPFAAPEFSEWSTPINLNDLNSPFDDGGPAISKNGLSLYFHSTRPGGRGNTDVWVAHRESVTDSWGVPQPLGLNVNSAFVENSPNLSRDEHLLLFASDRPGGSGDLDIWVSWREHTHDDFGWQPAVNLGTGVNTAVIDAGQAHFDNDGIGIPQLFLTSNRPGGLGSVDIWVSEQNADGSFGSPVLVTEVNGPSAEQAPDIRFDGLEMFFQSNRSASIGLSDLWVSTRETVLHPWSVPQNLGKIVNTIYVEGQPSLSSDRETLLFFSNRPGGAGGNDLYVTTRTKGAK